MHSVEFYSTFIIRYGALGSHRNKFEKKVFFYPTSTSQRLIDRAEEENAMLILWEADQMIDFCTLFLVCDKKYDIHSNDLHALIIFL